MEAKINPLWSGKDPWKCPFCNAGPLHEDALYCHGPAGCGKLLPPFLIGDGDCHGCGQPAGEDHDRNCEAV